MLPEARRQARSFSSPETAMHKAVIGIVLMLGLMMFLRHQFQTVIERATGKTRPPLTHMPYKYSRNKCLVCGGTGRTFAFRPIGPNSKPIPQICQSCNGTGWIDDPTYDR